MKTLKRIIAVCFCVILSFSCISVRAEKQELHFNLKMDTVEATPGNTVTLVLNVENNPGIAAMSFTVHYDKSALDFVGYVDGIFPKDTISSQNGYVRVVYVGRTNKTGDGALCGFRFKVKRDAKAGLTPVTIKHIDYKKKGDSLDKCFANLSLDTLVANFTSGGVDVGYTLTNHTHEFLDWQTVIEPDCEKDGIKSRSCKNCKYSEETTAQKLGHRYEEKWTVDVAADGENDGTASRHCLNVGCDSKTNEKNFSLAFAEKRGIENKVGAKIGAIDWEAQEEQENEDDQSSKAPTNEKNENQNPQESQKETVKQQESEKESQNKVTKNENATSQELLEEVIKQEEEKETKKTLFDKLSEYLFGNENKGLFELIFGKSIQGELERLWNTILKIILVIF